MIRYLSGQVLATEERSLILLVNHVGYQVFAPKDLILEHDEELKLYIHTHVRETEQLLYGFRTLKELQFFELLLGVNGVGPKMALAFFELPVDRIQNAILSEDIATLTLVPGVGKKIAQRMVIELKNKVEPGLDAGAPAKAHSNEEAILALESLGYTRKHIQSVLRRMDSNVQETEAVIRLFLQNAS